VLTFILDTIPVGFLEISYALPPITFKVVKAYEGEHLSNILVYEFEHMPKKGRMCVFEDSFSEPDWFHGSKV